MRVTILSRYQNKVERGAENFVTELSSKLTKSHELTILSGTQSDSLRSILSTNPDIVIPINGRMQALKASLGRIIGGYKLLISGHSGIGRDDLWNILVVRPNIFVALTSVMEKWVKRFAWGCKVVKIPDGVDLKKFSPIGEKLETGLPSPIILSVGALEWYKHHEKAIDAVSFLSKGSLVVVGDGAEKERLEKYGNKKLGNRFRIIKLTNDQMPRVYRTADVFTLPSWDREAFGIVYLEAMACNIPVVAPDDLSRREIIGDAGILVDTEDIEKYAESIEKTLNTKWGQKPREQAEKFSWEKIAKEYENIFLNMMK